MRIYCLILSIGLLLFSSCEKVINLNLKDSDRKIVIVGNITDFPGLSNHYVQVSKTTNFTADKNNDPVSGALVVVEDLTSGMTDTLKEVDPGNYITRSITGVSGHNYRLTVVVEGKTYTSSSTMPALVPFDSLYSDNLVFFGETIHQVIPVFQDPLGEKNYYRFAVQVNDSAQNGYQAWDDRLSDGKINSRPLSIFYQEWFNGDDTVVITMDCIDKSTFDFLNTVESASGNGQTPANPLTNISGGGLGYFTASTTFQRKIIVP